ncbi:hypothetical protein DCC81_14830 [Chitinophaga parva]|uniref:Uncharacterized protein n=1 Tax=Chitinophaga parva TaxID=2169414 RepID=A0A2T7BH05_9BACT|nr:hypothetical protein [Chitinophaga parva]PUZ25554.1 hypothetical protein DCC81_14830 [Chitinophaga parva]
MQIAEAANTWEPAFYLLKEKKYVIEPELDESENIVGWSAKKEDLIVYAASPLSLLGLVTLAETYGENWRKLDCRGLMDQLIGND